MPTVFTHGLLGLTASQLFLPEGAQQDNRSRVIFTALSVALPIVPDLDGLFLPVIPYAHALGHRGLSHSIVFAVFLGIVAAALMIREAPVLKGRRVWLVVYFTILTASHGILDAMTNGGLGIAFFAPFDNSRYFFPIRPIPASPIWPAQFASRYGLKVLTLEFLLIWTVCFALIVRQRRLRPLMLLLGSGIEWVVRMLEWQHKLTAVVLLLLGVTVWVVRII